MTFRKSVFWVHLATGLTAGLVVAIMSFTGTAIAFKREILAWVERDALRVTPPSPDAPRRPLSELIKQAREKAPALQLTGVTVAADPTQGVQVVFGREATYYVDPYTGEVREQGAKKWRGFFHVMEDWHRYLGAHDEQRALGKAVTGLCNAAFLFLALSGLFLWWPRKWRTKGLKRSVWFLRDATGRARDWNWHNVIGLWSAPVLIILTATGMVISYRWANDLVYQVTGSPVPVQQGPAGPGQPAPAAPAPSSAASDLSAKDPLSGTTAVSSRRGPKAASLPPEALIAAAQKLVPEWQTVTLRLGGNPRSAGSDQRPTGETRPPFARPAAPGPREGQPGSAPPPVVITVKERSTAPRFSNTTLTLDPFSAELLKRETFADGSLGRRVRTWMRFLHTGEALGLAGQFIGALASLGACFLVYTGFALSWRRFFMKKEEKA